MKITLGQSYREQNQFFNGHSSWSMLNYVSRHVILHMWIFRSRPNGKMNTIDTHGWDVTMRDAVVDWENSHGTDPSTDLLCLYRYSGHSLARLRDNRAIGGEDVVKFLVLEATLLAQCAATPQWPRYNTLGNAVTIAVLFPGLGL